MERTQSTLSAKTYAGLSHFVNSHGSGPALIFFWGDDKVYTLCILERTTSEHSILLWWEDQFKFKQNIAHLSCFNFLRTCQTNHPVGERISHENWSTLRRLIGLAISNINKQIFFFEKKFYYKIFKLILFEEKIPDPPE